jgi:hypothetical protein
MNNHLFVTPLAHVVILAAAIAVFVPPTWVAAQDESPRLRARIVLMDRLDSGDRVAAEIRRTAGGSSSTTIVIRESRLSPGLLGLVIASTYVGVTREGTSPKRATVSSFPVDMPLPSYSGPWLQELHGIIAEARRAPRRTLDSRTKARSISVFLPRPPQL